MKNLNKISLKILIVLIVNSCSINNERSSGIPTESIGYKKELKDLKELPLEISQVSKIKQAGKNDNEHKLSVYYIEPGDTLMLISLKLLGNHMKWRSIRKWNKQYIRTNDLIAGSPLYYLAQEIPKNNESLGLPYLIKKNDTLPKISGKVYGTKKSWDVIYFNNKVLIKSPDLIYSGLTIYYPLKENITKIKNEMAALHFEVYPKRKPASLR